MPTISKFYGIYIQMYYDEKHGPHFHAIYAEYRAMISIADGTLMGGQLPQRAYRLIRRWTDLHQGELEANWERARRREELRPIEGLE